MKLYQLVAVGPTVLFGSLHKFHSKRIFFSREHAEEYKEEFAALCMTKRNGYDLFELESVTEVRVLELELEE